MRRGFANLALLTLAGTVIAADPPAYLDPELTAKDREHWAFRKPVRPAVPAGATNPIDAFIRAQLTEKKLTPSPEADRRTLIRRVTYDLIGLPPTPAEVDAFLADKSANAYEKVVDRLLASPHFGERQAQHWLDLARFAESNGYELDADRPHAWRYRDYVINSFNADKPFDVFAKEQIAGDELAQGKPAAQVADQLIATGFHRAGPVHVVSGNLDAAVVRQEVLTEMVVGVGSAFLGLTMGCARCHDHKFDPLSQGDYYRFEAYFAGARFKDVELTSEAEQKKIAESNCHRGRKKRTDPQSNCGNRGSVSREIEAEKRIAMFRILGQHARFDFQLRRRPAGFPLRQFGGIDVQGQFFLVGVDGDAVAVSTKAIGPPTHASGATWPTTRPCVPPLNRPSVMRPIFSPSPCPISAPVTESISRMPGPPTGPSPRITTTSPASIFRAWIACEARLLAVEHLRRAGDAAHLQPGHLRDRPLRGEVALQDDDVPGRVHRLVERHAPPFCGFA